MPTHALLNIQATIPAYPLGKPLDGRARYGMTPEQAYVYRWLVAHKPHTTPFAVAFREVAQKMVSTPGNIHARVNALIERGWITRDDAGYRFVLPIRTFKEPR